MSIRNGEEQTCCLCSQIEGRPQGDLIASLLPDLSYRRRVALESPAFALLPSLGPLRPGHVLLCPKVHARSFAELDPSLAGELASLLARTRVLVAERFGGALHLFEHGTSASGGRSVCSTEHAHLHIVPMPHDVELSGSLDSRWADYDGSLRVLARRARGREYITYQPPAGAARLRLDTQSLPSQYMRRLLAEAAGSPGAWDWRVRPDAAAADRAWRRLTAAGAPVCRGDRPTHFDPTSTADAASPWSSAAS